MIETLSLFRPLNEKLISLLTSLGKSDWEKKPVAGNWTVKDIAAHLLDGNVRTISLYRDHVELSADVKISSYSDLVAYLNRLNSDWVKALKRMSPSLLTEFLTITHEAYIVCFERLDPHSHSKFSVAWAGDGHSPNWFHIAREFTEKWHHQQQIRHAVDQPGILEREFYYPVLDTFMQALPFQYRNTFAQAGTIIEIKIDSGSGGVWFLEMLEGSWKLGSPSSKGSQTKISIPAEEAWKLFTKAVSYPEIKDVISITGEINLAMPALEMLPIMAER